ncbi:MAG: FAD-dependent oxidoreductase [Planctomycetota bacterium]|jgi:NADPH-dependent glutamate synthase beta subunit-like oxidoreductase/ferredoxin
MPKLTIDNREVEVPNGATVLDAAGKLGIDIPTMCFMKGYRPSTSCMVCVVKVEGKAVLLPACGTLAEDGMRIESDCQEVLQARKTALELLLSDHVGDCLGPCHMICPAQMNIPLMIRQITAGKLLDAIETVKKDIALPAVLGRICPKPCERGCRRAAIDEPVSICLLKRYVADVDLESAKPYSPACQPAQDKRVAIIGAGPAGLAAAYYLRQAGFGCTVFDDHEQPGGMLRYGVSEEDLPGEVLDKEIAQIEKLGVKFEGKTRIEDSASLEKLRKDFDAVFVAFGAFDAGQAEAMGLKTSANGIAIEGKTYQTNLPGVFAGGDAVRKRRLTVRAVADGKEAAQSISRYLSGAAITGPAKPFNTRIGKIKDGEKERFAACASNASRVKVSQKGEGFTDEQAKQEAVRCLHCDCRKADNCKLRQYSQHYDARPTRYKGERRSFVQQAQHRQIIYESGKCIDCGLCVQITGEAGEELGLTFIGRGFDVRVAVPFEDSVAEGLEQSAAKCVAACPTGALAFKE